VQGRKKKDGPTHPREGHASADAEERELRRGCTSNEVRGWKKKEKGESHRALHVKRGKGGPVRQGGPAASQKSMHVSSLPQEKAAPPAPQRKEGRDL